MRARLRDKSATSNARFLWALIDTYADKWGAHAFPSINTLCKISLHDRKWVFKYLDELESLGWLHRTKRLKTDGSRASNLYILIYPVYRELTDKIGSGKIGTTPSAQNRHYTNHSTTVTTDLRL
jgi:hypothetical protein